MAGERPSGIEVAPRENFLFGLYSVEFPELGIPYRGKVADNWVLPGGRRLIVRSDRTSAHDVEIMTAPERGKVLNLLSAFWFSRTGHIVDNYFEASPHPNVTIGRQAQDVLKVEVVVREYNARSSTATSISRNYREGRRQIYGIKFPEGMKDNEKLPMGRILTPTTKAEKKGAHDLIRTEAWAKRVTDAQFGEGTWDKVHEAAYGLFDHIRDYLQERGLIFVDTKFEFGIDEHGKLMVIDEMGTPDTSRIWLAETYEARLAAGEQPDSFDKQIFRDWLERRGYRGKGPIPMVSQEIVEDVSHAYIELYERITGRNLPFIPSTQKLIHHNVMEYLKAA